MYTYATFDFYHLLETLNHDVELQFYQLANKIKFQYLLTVANYLVWLCISIFEVSTPYIKFISNTTIIEMQANIIFLC